MDRIRFGGRNIGFEGWNVGFDGWNIGFEGILGFRGVNVFVVKG